MSRMTITEAINHSPVGRTQFYKEYINTGKITVSTDERDKKFIDSSELLRVFGSLSENIHEQKKVDSAAQDIKDNPEQSELVKALREQIADLKSEREYYQTQVTSLQNRLEAPAANTKRINIVKRWWYSLDSNE